MIKITWLGQGGFLFEADNFRLLADPYISDCVFRQEGLKRLHCFPIPPAKLRADQLLVTHDHLDHLDPDGIPLIHEHCPACRYAGPQRSYEHFLRLGLPPHLLTQILPGSTHDFGPFTATAVFAAHSDPTACGYVLEAAGRRIYLSGDTLYDERLQNAATRHCDLMLICINGKLGNMNANEALQCVRQQRPKMALPMHIGLFAENTADPHPFVQSCLELGVKSFAMTPGEEFEI